MDNNTLAIYVHELRNLCDHTVASFDLFNQAARANRGSAILYAGQTVLSPMAQIAALLWPTRARARSRGEALRKVLGLKEHHVLNDRRMTELWERHDERLEDWITRTKGQHVIFDYIGDTAALQNGDQGPVEERNIYRAFDPGKRIYYYRGVGYNLQALADALSDLSARVWAVYKQLFPEHAAAEEEARRQALEAMKEKEKAANDEAAAQNVPTEATAPAKKPAAKKAPAKKAPAKKAPAKKPAAKKKDG